ncbi:Shedu anti-phage system protein SduA domain-containing protein [Streptomyces sp. MW-W600-10]|uniref:Shedu anti-phage system protein SduA domain-containing protein n=1 Tax=Streptomyces sp. MW-W600-10 TaxID=2829819 RepID=UPI001C492B34|nr:Shedu anti-phage system protein SduA domain-containing protein [Streptomyces sp. MW-W600-10]MBV7243561.1 DUF4263 domain-containing protein [Streptomyces sp. MW-W600-10]
MFINSDSDQAKLPFKWKGDVLIAPGHPCDGRRVSLENQSVLTHRQRGVPLRVFEQRGGECRYLGEFAVDPVKPIDGWVGAGERPPYQYSRSRTPRKMEAPLLRLRQLNGMSAIASSSDPFEFASRQSLSIQVAANSSSDDSPTEADQASGKQSSAVEAVRRLLHILENDPGLAQSLGGLDDARALATLTQHAQRQADLASLRAIVEDPQSSEHDIQKMLERMTWIFGGEFLPSTGRRRLTAQDQLDLVLLRPDGTLHGVEIKKSQIKKLVRKHLSHLVPGPDVYEAFGQAGNYLRSLDEERSTILANLGVDSRRASMTVVIGHTKFVGGDVSTAEIAETLRTMNSALSRVTITTYDQLIGNAQRTLSL